MKDDPEDSVDETENVFVRYEEPTQDTRTIRAKKCEEMLDVSLTSLVNALLAEEDLASVGFKGPEIWDF